MTDHLTLLTPDPSTAVELVRPYIVTGGRTRASRADLRWETLLERLAVPDGEELSTEEVAILDGCGEPTSIAELSAGAHLPLAVTTILAADLLEAGWIRVHETDPVAIELSALTRMIERVRSL